MSHQEQKVSFSAEVERLRQPQATTATITTIKTEIFLQQESKALLQKIHSLYKQDCPHPKASTKCSLRCILANFFNCCRSLLLKCY